MKIINKSLARVVALCSIALTISSQALAGYYQVTSVNWTGSRTYVGRKVFGAWNTTPLVETDHNLPTRALIVDDTAPLGSTVSIVENWTVTVTVDWVGGGTPTSGDVYVELKPLARAAYSNASPAMHEADNGFQDRPSITSSGSFSSTILDSQTHYIRLAGGQSTYTLSFSLKAKAQGSRIVGAPLTSVITATSLTAAISDRSVAIVANPIDPSLFRVAANVSGLNARNQSGTNFGDTAISIVFPTGMTVPSDSTGDVYVDFWRSLGGGWHTSATELFNEWWIDDVPYYYSDGALSENVNIPYTKLFGPSRPVKVTDLISGPYELKASYRATDQIDGIVGNANYILRVHLPAEKLSIDQTYTGPLNATPWAAVNSQYPEQIVASLTNNLPTAKKLTSITITSNANATFQVVQTTEGGVTLDFKALQINFGLSKEETTGGSSGIGTTFTFDEITLQPGETLEIFTVPSGKADKWSCSAWGTNGYIADGKCFDVRSNGNPFPFHIRIN